MAEEKIKPTTEMINFRKKMASEARKNNAEVLKYDKISNVKQLAIKNKLAKLKNDQRLAAEASIGYGLALKSIAENIESVEEELTKSQTEIAENRPLYNNPYGLFKAKFGYEEYEIDWGNKK